MKSWESQDVAYTLTEMKLHLLEKRVAFIYQQGNITSINSCWTLTGLAERGYVCPYSSVQLTGYWYWRFDSWTLIDSTSNGTLLWFFSTFSCKESSEVMRLHVYSRKYSWSLFSVPDLLQLLEKCNGVQITETWKLLQDRQECDLILSGTPQ